MAEEADNAFADVFGGLVYAAAWSLVIGPLVLIYQAVAWLRYGQWPDWSVAYAMQAAGMDFSGWVGLWRICEGVQAAFVAPIVSLGLISLFLLLHHLALQSQRSAP